MLRNVEPLTDFAAYCDRHPLTSRPTVWVKFTDIWGDPQGELGHADTDDSEVSQICFALLAPWSIIPTLCEAWLVVDRLESLKVTRLRVTGAGMFDPHWSVPYRMTDSGSLVFDEWEPETPMEPIARALEAAKQARMKQTYWGMGHTIETVLPVVEVLLREEAR